ncbi:pheromone precursor [Trametes sanguinea]|nr:pheromone precursor [Trametes sanguinea]
MDDFTVIIDPTNVPFPVTQPTSPSDYPTEQEQYGAGQTTFYCIIA